MRYLIDVYNANCLIEQLKRVLLLLLVVQFHPLSLSWWVFLCLSHGATNSPFNAWISSRLTTNTVVISTRPKVGGQKIDRRQSSQKKPLTYVSNQQRIEDRHLLWESGLPRAHSRVDSGLDYGQLRVPPAPRTCLPNIPNAVLQLLIKLE